jgi:hypothetical protein
MQKQTIPQGIEIDFCPSHGVWLDVGELNELMQRNAPSSPSMVQQMGQQFGQSVVVGAGATLGNRVVGGIINAIFGR